MPRTYTIPAMMSRIILQAAEELGLPEQETVEALLWFGYSTLRDKGLLTPLDIELQEAAVGSLRLRLTRLDGDPSAALLEELGDEVEEDSVGH